MTTQIPFAYGHRERDTTANAKLAAQIGEIVVAKNDYRAVYKAYDSTFSYIPFSASMGVNVQDEGLVANDATKAAANYTALVAAITKSLSRGVPLVIPKGTFYYDTKITLDATHNGLMIMGYGRFSSILQYTGSDDGFSIGANLNGLVAQDFRVTSATGRDAFSVGQGAASSTPDAGVVHLARLDIRGFLRHGIKSRLTVDLRTDHLEVVLNGGCGLYVENANPYRSTTFVDTGSWFHQNGGHGIVLKGTFTHTLNGTISDSNTGVSTDVDTISCAGYTLIGGGAWTNCISTDIGKSVTQGGVTVGTLAHYSNVQKHMVINCTTAPSGTGALAVTTGTGASATSTFRKNSHGLYAARTAYLHVLGGHYENHLYGIFLDSVYDSVISPGYILTQGTGAYGSYFAGNCSRISAFIAGVDVQAGGQAAAYRGPLTIGVYWHMPGAYTTEDESANSTSFDTQNAGSTQVSIRSTGANPLDVRTTNPSLSQFQGADATTNLLHIDGAARAGLFFSQSLTELARVHADNALAAFVWKLVGNIFAIYDTAAGSTKTLVQANDATGMYLAIQGKTGPGYVELSSGGSDGSALVQGEYSAAARLNNGEKDICIIRMQTMGAVANERGGKILFITRTSGAAGAQLQRATLDETAFTLLNSVALVRTSQTGITASTTQTQGQGALTKDINIVSTCANANDTVTLPAAVAGMEVYIRNNGAQTLKIFPASGNAINGAAANASTTLAAGASVTYRTADTTNWYT